MSETTQDARGRFHGLADRHQWMWWFYLVLVVVGAVGVVRGGWLYLVYTPQALAVGIVLAVLLAAVLLAIAHRIDRWEIVPSGVVAGGLAWGGLAAVPLALFANDNMLTVWRALGLGDWAAALTGPTDEETIKLVGVVALLYLTRWGVPRPMDGMLYGIAVGIGFEVVENTLYAVQTAATDPNSDVGAAIGVGISRILFGFGGHAIFTGVAGFGMGYALTRRDTSTARRVGAAAGAFVVAWFLHFLWNSPLLSDPALLGMAVKYLILLAAFFTAARAGRREEREWIGETLAGQPAQVVGPGDVDALVHHGPRHEARARARQAGGRPGVRAFANLQEGQVVLASLLRTPEPDGAAVARQQRAVATMRAEAERYGVVQPAADAP